MGAPLVVDTNAIIDFLNGKLPVPVTHQLELLLNEQQISLSVIVRIELLSWVGAPAELRLLASFIAASNVLPLDEPVIQQTILLRQQHRVKLPDAIIAATALAHSLPLLTRNTADFQRVIGLVLHDPHAPGHWPGPERLGPPPGVGA